MIQKIEYSEFGSYKRKYNHGYPVHNYYQCTDAYKETDWQPCPCCGLKPKVWRFDNGLSTACGCGFSRYDHFSVNAESIMSVYTRTGNTSEYNPNQLKRNWDEYCATMINPCSLWDLRVYDKW